MGLHRGSTLTSFFCGDALIDNVVLQVKVACVGTRIFETNNAILHKSKVQCFHNWEYRVGTISNVPRSVRKPYLRASYHVVYKVGCLLMRGISLPVAQLFVIAIESILLGAGGGGEI